MIMSKNKIDKRFINIYRVKRAYQKHVSIGFNGFDPQSTKSPDTIIGKERIANDTKMMPNNLPKSAQTEMYFLKRGLEND